MKRKLSVILKFAMVLAIAFNTLTIGASAIIGDGNMLSADINLEVGTISGSVFTPLAAGTALHTGDIITVRICPTTDFYCGATRYVVLFSREFLEVRTAGNAAFTPNSSNSFYANVASGCAGMTGDGSGEAAKSGIPVAEFNKVYATNGQAMYNEWASVAVGNQANSNSVNGGYPGTLPGDWLFRFNLVVKKDITTGSDARIWMDKNWFRSPQATDVAAYFSKCDAGQLSSSGNSVSYNFDIDVTGADVNLAPEAIIAIAQNGTELVAPLQIKVPWYKSYKKFSAQQLGFISNVEDYDSIEWSSSDTSKVLVGTQTGLIVNIKTGARSANITVKLFDSNDILIASDTVKVIFYKYNFQLKKL